RHAVRGNSNEVAVTPLADGPDVRVDVVDELHLADDRVEAVRLDRLDHGSAVLGTGLLDRLAEDLQASIGGRARPEVRTRASRLGVALDVVGDLRVLDVDAADAEDALSRLAEAACERREGGADAGVERADLEILDLRLLGEREGLA